MNAQLDFILTELPKYGDVFGEMCNKYQTTKDLLYLHSDVELLCGEAKAKPLGSKIQKILRAAGNSKRYLEFEDVEIITAEINKLKEEEIQEETQEEEDTLPEPKQIILKDQVTWPEIKSVSRVEQLVGWSRLPNSIQKQGIRLLNEIHTGDVYTDVHLGSPVRLSLSFPRNRVFIHIFDDSVKCWKALSNPPTMNEITLSEALETATQIDHWSKVNPISTMGKTVGIFYARFKKEDDVDWCTQQYLATAYNLYLGTAFEKVHIGIIKILKESGWDFEKEAFTCEFDKGKVLEKFDNLEM